MTLRRRIAHLDTGEWNALRLAGRIPDGQKRLAVGQPPPPEKQTAKKNSASIAQDTSPHMPGKTICNYQRDYNLNTTTQLSTSLAKAQSIAR